MRRDQQKDWSLRMPQMSWSWTIRTCGFLEFTRAPPLERTISYVELLAAISSRASDRQARGRGGRAAVARSSSAGEIVCVL